MAESLKSSLESHRNALADHVPRIASEVASKWAKDVDEAARFPVESVSALREVACLSAGVPTALGGAGYSITELAEICATLGQHCASTGMILAMHFAQVGCLVHAGGDVSQINEYLRRVAREQRLIASVTSEIGTDGDLRRSVAGLSRDTDGSYSIVKDAPTVSYGEYADDLLITVRSSVDAANNDQRLVLALSGDFSLVAKSVWDTLGMRGTCSPAARVAATMHPWQVLPTAFATIAERYMVPYSHILWASVWLGLAVGAMAKARRAIQGKARKEPHSSPQGASRLTELGCKLQLMRSDLVATARFYEHLLGSDRNARSADLALSLKVNNLKLNASRLVREIVTDAIEICGISGYRNDSEASLSRHLRDASSAALMVSNQRIVDANSMMHLVHKGGTDSWVDLRQ